MNTWKIPAVLGSERGWRNDRNFGAGDTGRSGREGRAVRRPGDPAIALRVPGRVRGSAEQPRCRGRGAGNLPEAVPLGSLGRNAGRTRVSGADRVAGGGRPAAEGPIGGACSGRAVEPAQPGIGSGADRLERYRAPPDGWTPRRFTAAARAVDGGRDELARDCRSNGDFREHRALAADAGAATAETEAAGGDGGAS